MRKHLANAVSATRIIFAPVIVWAILSGQFQLATILYVAGWASDVVDGYIARKLEVQSKFGEMFDPACSVVLVYSTLGALVFVGRLPIWVLVAAAAASFIPFVGSLLTYGKTQRLLGIVATIIGGGLVDGGTGLGMSWVFLNPIIAVAIILGSIIVAIFNLTRKI